MFSTFQGNEKGLNFNETLFYLKFFRIEYISSLKAENIASMIFKCSLLLVVLSALILLLMEEFLKHLAQLGILNA